MPSDAYALHKKITQWLNTHWSQERTCAVCGHDNWALGNFVTESLEYLDKFTRADIADEHDFHPRCEAYFTVFCLNCGHTYFFNAEIAGITTRRLLRERGEFEGKRLASFG